MMRRIVLSVAVLGLFTVGACASTGQLGGDSDVLTREQIASIETNNVHEVVRRLRPLWLKTRVRNFTGGMQASPLVVYRDNVRLGGIDELRNLSPDIAQWISFLDSSEASATLPGLGSTMVEGAIVVHTTPRENEQ